MGRRGKGDREGKAASKVCFQASHHCGHLELKAMGKHHVPEELGCL